MRAWILVMMMLAAIHIAGCGTPPQGCTLIGCQSGTNLTLTSSAGGSLPPGDYSVVVAGIGTDSCTIDSDGGTSNCNSGGAPEVFVDGGLVFFFPASSESPPPSLDVTVTRGGTQLFNMSVPESPRELFPNGVNCGGGCSQASVTVPVP